MFVGLQQSRLVCFSSFRGPLVLFCYRGVGERVSSPNPCVYVVGLRISVFPSFFFRCGFGWLDGTFGSFSIRTINFGLRLFRFVWIFPMFVNIVLLRWVPKLMKVIYTVNSYLPPFGVLSSVISFFNLRLTVITIDLKDCGRYSMTHYFLLNERITYLLIELPSVLETLRVNLIKYGVFITSGLSTKLRVNWSTFWDLEIRRLDVDCCLKIVCPF